MNTELMLKIADQIEHDPEQFAYRSFANECGTAFCVAGWAMVLDGWSLEHPTEGFFRYWTKGDCKIVYIEATGDEASAILRLDTDQMCNLFYAEAFPEGFHTPVGEVAEYIRNMVKEYENEY